MKANELRQGNLILGIYEQEIDRGNGIIEDVEYEDVVTFLGYDPFEKYFWVEGGEVDDYDRFNAIPLTEEWLERFGFSENSFTRNYIDIDYTIDGLRLCLDNDDCESGYGIVSLYGKLDGDVLYLNGIDYVHQLQNLYFALSGEELTLKK